MQNTQEKEKILQPTFINWIWA